MSAPASSRDPLHQQVFRPRFAPFLAYIWYVAAVLYAIDLVRRGDLTAILVGLGVLLLISVVLYAGAQRPALIVDDLGVTLRNLVRDVYVPWHEVRRVGAVWSLSIATDRGEYRSWAITATNPHRRRAGRRRGVFGLGPALSTSFEPAPDQPEGMPGLVSATIAQRQEKALRQEPTGEVSIRIAWEVLVPFAVAVVLLIAGVLS